MARRVSVNSVNSINSEKRLGKPFEYDRDFKGPTDRRSCTDVLCLALFLVFLVAWAVIGVYAYHDLDPQRILRPTDFLGQQCGMDAKVITKPYLLEFDPSLCVRPALRPVKSGSCTTPNVCVASCPTDEFYAPKYYRESTLSYLPVRPICLANVPLPRTGPELRALVESNKCAKQFTKTIALDGRCVIATAPDTRDSLTVRLAREGFWRLHTVVVNGLSLIWVRDDVQQAGDKVVSDTLQSYPFILGGLAGAMALSMLYIVLLRWLAGVVVWISILLVLVLLGVLVYFCCHFWLELKDGGGSANLPSWGDAPPALRSLLDDPTTWLVLMILSAVILGVLLLVVLFLRQRITLAVTLIEQGGRAVSSISSTLLFPVLGWALQVAVVAYAAMVMLHLATSGEAIYKTHGLNATADHAGCKCMGLDLQADGVDCDPETFKTSCSNCVANGAACVFFRYNPPEYTKWLQVYNIFGTIWALFFISGMSQMILAATFATWYWTFNKSDVPFFVLTRSFFMSVTYHSGTVAFGSLIISIVRFIRLILDYIEKQAKQYSDNAVARCVMCFCKCCFACIEGFLKFISRNAYIMCAVHGKNFCTSAKDAFNLLMRNVIRCVVIDKIMDFVFFMGKLLITLLVCTAMYLCLLKWPQNLNYNAVPITITGVGSFLIASIFFGVYSMAVETLFLCFLEDCERNDGSAERPYYMSPSLMRVFGKKNRRD